jgi:cytoskeletal protein CcmA (bactofilin family)
MWNKTPSPVNPAPSSPAVPATPTPPAPALHPPSVTLIGESIKIKGQIKSNETLQLDGEMEGQLDIGDRLIVGAKAKVAAQVKAKEVDVAGVIRGNVVATERLVLRKGAHLEGDVKTAGIVIEDGAYFKGGIDITGSKAVAQKA